MFSTMRVLGITDLMLFCSAIPFAQDKVPDDNKVFFSFGAWQKLHNDSDKSFMYIGFVNGFFAGDRSVRYDSLAKCIERHISPDQAIAMIDKYSTDNPQRWSVPLPMGVAEALTVKDGPCPGLNPFN